MSSVLWESPPVFPCAKPTREYFDETSAEWWSIPLFREAALPPMAPGLAEHKENLHCMLQDVESSTKSSLLAVNKSSLLSELFLPADKLTTPPVLFSTRATPPPHKEAATTQVSKSASLSKGEKELPADDDMPILHPQNDPSQTSPSLEMPTLVPIAATTQDSSKEPEKKSSTCRRRRAPLIQKKLKKKLKRKSLPQIDLIDGVQIYSFSSESELKKYSSKRDCRPYLEDSPGKENIIVPTKTQDITQIKGWRTKYFTQVLPPEPLMREVNSKKPTSQVPETMKEGPEPLSQLVKDAKLSVFFSKTLDSFLEGGESKLEINHLTHFNPNVKPLKEDAPIFHPSPFIKELEEEEEETCSLPAAATSPESPPPKTESPPSPPAAATSQQEEDNKMAPSSPSKSDDEESITEETPSTSSSSSSMRVVIKLRKDPNGSDVDYKVADFNLGEEKAKTKEGTSSTTNHGWVYQGMETPGNLIQKTLWTNSSHDKKKLKRFLDEQNLLAEALELQKKHITRKPSLDFPLISEERAREAVAAFDLPVTKHQAKKRKHSAIDNASLLQNALESSQNQKPSLISSLLQSVPPQQQQVSVAPQPTVLPLQQCQESLLTEGTHLVLQKQGPFPLVVHQQNQVGARCKQPQTTLMIHQQVSQHSASLVIQQSTNKQRPKALLFHHPGSTPTSHRPSQVMVQKAQPAAMQFVNLPAQLLIPRPKSPLGPIIVSVCSKAEDGNAEEPEEKKEDEEEVECIGSFMKKPKGPGGGEVPLIVINSSDSEDDEKDEKAVVQDLKDKFVDLVPEVGDMTSVADILNQLSHKVKDLQGRDKCLSQQRDSLNMQREQLYNHYTSLLNHLVPEQKKSEQLVMVNKLKELSKSPAPSTSSETKSITVHKTTAPPPPDPLPPTKEPAQKGPLLLFKIGDQGVGSLTRVNLSSLANARKQLQGNCRVTRVPRTQPNNIPPTTSSQDGGDNTTVWVSGDGEPCIVTRLNDEDCT